MNIILRRWCFVRTGLLLAATNFCVILTAAPLSATHFVIRTQVGGYAAGLGAEAENGIRRRLPCPEAMAAFALPGLGCLYKTKCYTIPLRLPADVPHSGRTARGQPSHGMFVKILNQTDPFANG
jgi:hypothetical protein